MLEKTLNKYYRKFNFDNKEYLEFLRSKLPDDIKSYSSVRNILKKYIIIKNPVTIDYWIQRGYTIEEAIDMKSQQQKIRSKVSVEHWLNKGYSLEESKKEVSKIQSKISTKTHNERKDTPYAKENSIWCKEYYIKRGFSNQDAIEEISAVQRVLGRRSKGKNPIHKRNTRIEYYLLKTDNKDEAREMLSKRQSTKGPWKNYNEYLDYSRKVRKISDRWVKLGKVPNSDIRSNEWHLDHIFSIAHGYLKKIDVDVVGHWTNLQIISALENKTKGWHCHKSEGELLNEYKQSMD